MNDLRIEARFKNARLWEAIEARFRARQPSAMGCVSLAAKEIGLAASTIGTLLTLRVSPYARNAGQLTKSAQQIADFFSMNPEELFPRSLYALTLPAIIAKTVDSEDVLSLQQAQAQGLLPAVTMHTDGGLGRRELMEEIDRVLETLTPREEKVIKMRFGLEGDGERTLEEVGQSFAISRERVRQIEAKALRKLRQPSRSRKLKPLLAAINQSGIMQKE